MLHQIGDSDYGLYTLATSIISIFTIDFGMSAAVSRFISKYRAEKKQNEIDRFLGIVYRLYLIIDAVLLIALVFVFLFIDRFTAGLTGAELERFKVVYIIVATYTVISFPFITLNGILNSYEKFIQLKVCDILNKVVTVGITVIALLGGLGLYTLVLVNVIVHLLTISVKLLVIQKTTPARVRFVKLQRKALGEIFNFSLWTTVVSISKRFLQNVMPVLLGNVCTTVQITIYGIGSVIEGYAYLMVSAITGMMMPRVSRISVGEHREKELNALMCKVGRFQYFIIGLIFAGFAVCGKQFVQLCYGAGRIDAYYVALLMIFPHLFYAPQQIAQTTVTVENKVKLQAYVHVAAAIINVGLAYVLIRHYGVIGGALSICIVYILRMLCMNVIYHKVLHLNMWQFYYNVI
ncbi:MAG: oligosaccharide flippase family protein [Clostridia bacterium]|nr:oligosaccharide flippase family protein [Clostridia bacterium]